MLLHPRACGPRQLVVLFPRVESCGQFAKRQLLTKAWAFRPHRPKDVFGAGEAARAGFAWVLGEVQGVGRR